jgi:hypothetical protein
MVSGALKVGVQAWHTACSMVVNSAIVNQNLNRQRGIITTDFRRPVSDSAGWLP